MESLQVRPSRKKRILFAAQITALIVGAVLVGWPAFVFVRSSVVQWFGVRQIDRAYESAKSVDRKNPPAIVSPPAVVVKKPAVRPPAKGSLLAKLEVPRLHMSLVVLEGADLATLDKSIGHVTSTAMPGEYGNIGIAGHRNTHFKKMEWIRQGDEMILTSSEDRYRYLVESIRLVTPDDVEVLDDSLGPAITIVTCFPFEYVGHAPQRFIVRAVPDQETRPRLARIISSR
jgi:sortase A